MENLWNDIEAGKQQGILAERVYSSRLLGANPDLVLHGGGNTSVKGVSKNIFGENEATLFVKGSGSDLATIEAKDFVAVRLDAMLKLSRLESLSDIDMARELKLASLDPNAPAPSVEAILHALIPHRFIDHTHADAIVTITNTADGEARIRELFGDEAIVLPYVMPGFDLAKLCAEVFSAQATARTIGMGLMNHGIFSFGDTAKQSYDRMIELVGRADDYLKKSAPLVPAADIEPAADWSAVPELRKQVSAAAGFPLLLRSKTVNSTLAFARHPGIGNISQRGPATPDHIIRTKRLPLLGRDVEAYAQAYKHYFEKNSRSAKAALTMLDPAPRVIIDSEFGLVSAGRSARDTQIIEDIYLHTQDIIRRGLRHRQGLRAVASQPRRLRGGGGYQSGGGIAARRACRFSGHHGRYDFGGRYQGGHRKNHSPLRRPRYAGAECRHLSRRQEDRRAGRRRVAQGDGDQPGRQSGDHARGTSVAESGAAVWPPGGDRLEECSGAGPRRGGLFRVQGSADATGPRRPPGGGGGG